MNIGDRVIDKSGCKGTIVNIYKHNRINKYVFSVEFDTFFNAGHGCEGYAKEGHGWNYLMTDFEDDFSHLTKNKQYLLF
jgi:hypothetical protein